MANGWWGSRIPVINLLLSNFIFICVRFRIIICRFKNLIKNKKVKIINDTLTTIALNTWIDQGFDKINVGGGAKNLEGFFNIDFVHHPDVKREVVANILDLSFIPSGSMKHIHSNHVLEHLTEQQLQEQLLSYYRILTDGGYLTIRCPNALGASFGFWFEPILEKEREKFIALGFPCDESFGKHEDKWLHKDFFGLLHWFYGDMGNIENQHLTIITPTKIKGYIDRAGFKLLVISEPEALNIVLVAQKE